MLFFRFNLRNFKPPMLRVLSSEVQNGVIVSKPCDTTKSMDFGMVRGFYFRKIREDLSISNGIGFPAYTDLIGIPVESDYIVFSVDDEALNTRAAATKFVFSEYSKIPISELGGKSLNDIGITVEFYSAIANSEINTILTAWAKSNNLESLNEEVLWKNLTDPEKIGKFSAYLTEIASNGNELVVVDPYLFYPCRSERPQYINLLSGIFNASMACRIATVTDSRHFDSQLFSRISELTNIPITNNFSCDFHDRFWIANRLNGFCTGTSLNGIGKRISIISYLSHEDVNDIIQELLNQSLI